MAPAVARPESSARQAGNVAARFAALARINGLAASCSRHAGSAVSSARPRLTAAPRAARSTSRELPGAKRSRPARQVTAGIASGRSGRFAAAPTNVVPACVCPPPTASIAARPRRAADPSATYAPRQPSVVRVNARPMPRESGVASKRPLVCPRGKPATWMANVARIPAIFAAWKIRRRPRASAVGSTCLRASASPTVPFAPLPVDAAPATACRIPRSDSSVARSAPQMERRARPGLTVAAQRRTVSWSAASGFAPHSFVDAPEQP